MSGQLGPITAIHWNAYPNAAGDVLTVQEALPDPKAAKGAVLVTNDGLGLFDPRIDATAV